MLSPLKLLLVSMLVLLVGSISGVALYLHFKGDRLLSVQTDSMFPTFKRGDAVLTRPAILKELQEGDIISYYNPANKRVIVSHRLVAINYQTGRLVTEGDNNNSTDLPFPASQLVGKVYKILPGLGARLDWLHTTKGLSLVIYVPAALVIIVESRRLSMGYKHKRYLQHSSFVS